MLISFRVASLAFALSLSQALASPSFGDPSPPATVSRQVERLSPQRPGIINVYAIAVGGDGQDDVFEREVRAVETRLEEQLNVSGRIVTLVNRRQLPQPEATLITLQYVIQRISELMNKDEDLLFVHIASHGSPNRQLALIHPSKELYWLGNKQLASLLKKSGIRHKVIVISVC